jgi:hypothetical protein
MRSSVLDPTEWEKIHIDSDDFKSLEAIAQEREAVHTGKRSKPRTCVCHRKRDFGSDSLQPVQTPHPV